MALERSGNGRLPVTLGKVKLSLSTIATLGVGYGQGGLRGKILLMPVGKGSFDQQPLVVVRPHDRDGGRQDLNLGKRGRRLPGMGDRSGGAPCGPLASGRGRLRIGGSPAGDGVCAENRLAVSKSVDTGKSSHQELISCRHRHRRKSAIPVRSANRRSVQNRGPPGALRGLAGSSIWCRWAHPGTCRWLPQCGRA